MKCPQCEQENREAARFCQNCGAPLPAAAITEAVQPQELEQEVEQVALAADAVVPLTSTEEAAALTEVAQEATLVRDQVECQPIAGEPEADRAILEQVEPEPEIERAEPAVEVGSGLEQVEVEAVEPGPSDLSEENERVGEAWAPQEPEGDEMLPEFKGEIVLDQARLAEPLPEQAEAEQNDLLAGEAAQAEEPRDDRAAEGDGTEGLFWRETPQAMVALEPGTVINGRYQVSEVLSAGEKEVLYRVRDLKRCPRCGFDGNNPDQAFCDSCGAMFDQKAVALMRECPVGQEEELMDAAVEDRFVEGERAYWVWRESSRTEPLGGGVERMCLLVGQKTDVGQKRPLDEDSLFVLTTEGAYASLSRQLALFIVADGMGGHEAGEVASKLAIQTTVGQLVNSVFAPELVGRALSVPEIKGRMAEAMQAANERVYLERQKRNNDMGTTMTAAVLKDRSIYLAHVGDCRAYLWGAKGLEQITTDHSIVASMVATGAAQPEDIYTHPQRSVIYRSIGDRPTVDVDSFELSVSSGDRLVICSDGLWEMIRNEGIEEVLMRESDPQAACEVMVEQANLAGGTDNISVIVVQL